MKVSHRWNVTTLNNFLARELLILYIGIWFGLEIWIEIVEYPHASCWLQSTGIKPPTQTQAAGDFQGLLSEAGAKSAPCSRRSAVPE